MAIIRQVVDRYPQVWIIGFLLLMLASCKPTVKGVGAETIESFATLQCQAIKLKTKRYELSDTLRNVESKSPIDIVKIARIKDMADSLKTQSLDLADVIKNRLDSIFETLKEVPEEKVIFYKKLEEKLTEAGCITQ